MKVTFEKAVGLINKGETVAIPTETVYGLAADAFNINAVKKIFEQKGRPSKNPLIVHISTISQLNILADNIPEDLHKLADAFWPGPVSMVLKKKNRVPDIVTGGLETVAVRMPDHPLALALIERTGPLTAPSANKSGRPSPTNPKHIQEDFGTSLPILDGGSSKLGLESTVLDLTDDEYTILRPGFITAEMIENILGRKIGEAEHSNSKSAGKSPGTQFTHYKPKAAVHWLSELPSDAKSSGNYYILHSNYPDRSVKNIHSYYGDYESLARDLYDHFRTADHLSSPHIFIESFESSKNHPLIAALKDRINRAIQS